MGETLVDKLVDTVKNFVITGKRERNKQLQTRAGDAYNFEYSAENMLK